MSIQAVTDIDVLALAVRDRESRRLIEEAITAYRGGALRSAIMSVWILPASRDHWQRFVDEMTAQHGGKTDTPYSYPSIRAKLDAA